MLTRQVLDRLASQGCQHVDHDPEECQNDGTIFLHCRHHPEAGFDFHYCISYYLKCQHKGCPTELEFVSPFTATGNCETWTGLPFRFRPECHSKGSVWASYTLNSGKVKIFCRVCEQNIGFIDLDKDMEDEG